MSENKNIKIFIAYHKDAQRITSDILTPIHVGRAVASDETKESLKDIIGDDTGDNISYKNPNYCELTALYWAWKNCDADYIGFMHYRRHFNFNEKIKYKENKWGIIDTQTIDSQYIEKYGLCDSTISSVVKKYDLLIPTAWNVKNAKSTNNYMHYKSSSDFLHIKDYDKALNILLNKYPEYQTAIEKYNKSKYGYYTNMFVMKKELFQKYAEWMFSILFELEKQTDLTKYDTQSARIYGYISEWLTGIFITHLILNKNLKIKKLQRTFVHNTNISRNTIPVCFSADSNYFKPLYVAILSLLINKNIDDFYEINIIDGGILDKDKILLEKLKDKYDFSLHFLKIDKEKFLNFSNENMQHISIATYYRYLLPELLPDYNKVIYLDCDMVVCKSLQPLFNIELENNYFAGVIDILVKENTERLNLEKYVNAGVLLVNLKKWREIDATKYLFEYTLNNKDKIVWWDQDVLNTVLQDGIMYIPEKWNLQTSSFVDRNYKKYFKQQKDIAIIHFITSDKPWLFASRQQLKKYFYKVLKKTPFKLLYLKCIIGDLCKFIFYYRKGDIKELRILGIQIFIRTKKDGVKNLKILNIYKSKKSY